MTGIEQTGVRRKGIIALGSVIGALLASTCCIVPLFLVTLGASGAWIGSLTAMAPYQGYVLAVTLAFIGLGFWHVYWKPKRDCDDGYCVAPGTDRVVKVALWVATLLVAAAFGVNYILPSFA